MVFYNPLRNHVLSLWHVKKMLIAHEEFQLSFLLSGICNVVPSSNYKLRNYLKSHLSNLAEKYNINLPKNFRNRNETCPYCYTPWKSETTSFKLLPTKKSKFRPTEKSRNTLVLKCKVCTHKSLFSLIKKERVKNIVKEEVILTKKKKKKKKKDKTCGLNINTEADKTTPKPTKKKKRQENIPQVKNSNPTVKNQQSNHSESTKNKQTSKPNTVNKNKNNNNNNNNKKLFPNPFAPHQKSKSFNKKNKKLQNLKNAIRKDKGSNFAKKTLNNFLKLV